MAEPEASLVEESPRFQIHADKRSRAYVPSYDWGSERLGVRHKRIADAVWDVPGWLTEEDALKLYELAFFANGPILEVGTFCGRSAVVMATALSDRGANSRLVSLDTDGQVIALAQRFLRAHRVEGRVLLVCDSASRFLSTVPEFRPSLVFIDGDHTAAGVEADLECLARCVNPGTLLVFHDYCPGSLPDTRGFHVSPEPIEVAETVDRSWVPRFAEFAGTFGWSAVFRVRVGPPIDGTGRPGDD